MRMLLSLWTTYMICAVSAGIVIWFGFGNAFVAGLGVGMGAVAFGQFRDRQDHLAQMRQVHEHNASLSDEIERLKKQTKRQRRKGAGNEA